LELSAASCFFSFVWQVKEIQVIEERGVCIFALKRSGNFARRGTVDIKIKETAWRHGRITPADLIDIGFLIVLRPVERIVFWPV